MPDLPTLKAQADRLRGQVLADQAARARLVEELTAAGLPAETDPAAWLADQVQAADAAVAQAEAAHHTALGALEAAVLTLEGATP